MSKKTQAIIWIIVAVLAIAGIGYCVYAAVANYTNEPTHPEVKFNVEGYGDVKIKLYPEYAPNTVTNFIKLAQAGYYNGKVVYGKDTLSEYWGRNTEGNVDNPKLSLVDSSVQEGTDADYDYEINGEFIANKFNQNTLQHKKGIVSMVRADYTTQIQTLIDESYNSAGSQFTIIMADNARELNGMYAAFGEVEEGLDIVEKIYNTAIKVDEEQTGNTTQAEAAIERFETMPIINSTEVETYGVEYGIPKTHKAFDYSSYLYELMSRYYSGNSGNSGN